MRMLGRVALATALMVPVVVAPVEAQRWRWDLGVNGGFSWYSAMLGSEDTGIPDGSDRDSAFYGVIAPEWPAGKARLQAKLDQ